MTSKIAHINFRRVIQADLPLLYTWFEKPHVAAWWPVPEENEFFKDFLEKIRSKTTIPLLVYSNQIPIGYLQYYHIDRTREKAGSWLPTELPVTTIGTDQFIGDENYLGKGYGTLLLKEFIKQLHDLEPTVTTVIVDPDPENAVAIRCYEKVGFTRMGMYQAPWGPALLMKYVMKEPC
jgi:RimJ/RimL family protein N-acetyltransferase